MLLDVKSAQNDVTKLLDTIINMYLFTYYFVHYEVCISYAGDS